MPNDPIGNQYEQQVKKEPQLVPDEIIPGKLKSSSGETPKPVSSGLVKSPLSLLRDLKGKKLILAVGGVLFFLILLILIIALAVKPRLATPNVTATPTPSGQNSTAYSEGKIAFVRDAEVYLTNLADLSTNKIATLPRIEESVTTQIDKMVWSTDGRLLAFIVTDTVSNDSTLQLIKVADGSATGSVIDVLSTNGDNRIYDFDWIPDSYEVVVSYADEISGVGTKHFLGKISVLGFPGTKQFLDWVRPINGVQISQGGFIYFLDETNELWRVSLSGGKFYPVLRGIASFEISPNGAKIVYNRIADGEIWVTNENGANPKQITYTSAERMESYGLGGRSNPHWGNDNRTILFTETGVDYVGIGFVNEDSTGLRSVEENSISPKIKYSEYYNRQLSDPIWAGTEHIVFIGSTNDENFTDNLYLLNSTNGEFYEVASDAVKPSWTK